MKLKAAEISDIIRRQIRDYEREVDVAETGTVLSVGDGIGRVYGLEQVMAGELVEFPGGVRGMVLNLEDDNVGVAIMGEDVKIKEGDIVRRTGEIIEVPVGEGLCASSTHWASPSTARVQSSGRRLDGSSSKRQES